MIRTLKLNDHAQTSEKVQNMSAGLDWKVFKKEKGFNLVRIFSQVVPKAFGNTKNYFLSAHFCTNVYGTHVWNYMASKKGGWFQQCCGLKEGFEIGTILS